MQEKRQSPVTGAGEMADNKGGLQQLKTVIFILAKVCIVFQGPHTTQVSMSGNQSNFLHTSPEHF